MVESHETIDRAQLEKAYQTPKQLDVRRSIGEYKSPKFNLNDEVLRALSLESDESLLEVGCGKGELVNTLTENSTVYAIGSDLSLGMIREASKKSSNFIVSDSQKLPFKEQSFDAVAAINMIYHVPDKNSALAEFGRVLKNNGRLVITGHSINDRNLSRKLRETVAQQFGLTNYPHPPTKFNTENGGELLKKYFPKVHLKLYLALIEVPEIYPHLAFFDSMRYFWDKQFSEDEWKDILAFAKNYLKSEIKMSGYLREETISGVFTCQK